MPHFTSGPQWSSCTRWAAAVACVTAACVSTPGLAAEEAFRDLKGRLYVGVYDVLPRGTPGRRGHLVVVDLATGGFQKVLDRVSVIRVSPDGKEVAYVRSDDKTAEVYRQPITFEGEPKYLWGLANIVGWTHDGEQLILEESRRVTQKPAHWDYYHYRIDADGTDAEQIDLPQTTFASDCTSDGKRLLVTGIVYKQLHVLSLATGDSVLVSPTDVTAYSGRFSPDDRRVAFATAGKPYRVMVVDADGKNARTVFEAEGPAIPRHVCWSPDGKYLAAAVYDAIEGPNRGNRDRNGRFILIDVETGDHRVLQMQGMAIAEMGPPDWGP